MFFNMHIKKISQDHGAVFLPLQNDLDQESSYSYTRLGKIENPAGLVDVLGRGNVRVARFSLSK